MNEIKAVKAEVAFRVAIQTKTENTYIKLYARDPKDAINKATNIFLDSKKAKEKAIEESPKVKKAKESLKKASDEAASQSVPDMPSDPLPEGYQPDATNKAEGENPPTTEDTIES